MQRILTVKEMQTMDRLTIDNLGIKETELIERAGVAVADEIINRLRGGRVLVVCGKGNNGEDGKVVAKILSTKHGFSVATVNIDNGIFKLFDKTYDIIVDCIFGTGLNREVTGKYRTAIEKINSSGAFVVSVDIPSGLNGDTGLSMGIAVKANLTIAIGELKIGHFINDGKDYCGSVIVKDIGISVWGEDFIKRAEERDIAKLFPKRQNNSNKGNYGRVITIGGSKNFPGSLLLSYSALTTLKAGVGYSQIAFPNSLYDLYALKIPEATIKPLTDNDGNLMFDENDYIDILKNDVIVFGMGVGVSDEIYKILSYLLTHYKGKLIIDADGLNTLSKYGVEMLKNKTCQVALTPHVMEFSRLCKIDRDEILKDTPNIANRFAKEYNVVLTVKSSTSIITNGEEVYLNTTGSPCMAKGGSGDVLAGLIGGISVRNDLFDSVIGASYIFGKAGEKMAKEKGEYTVIATDLVKGIEEIIEKFA